MSVMKTTQMQEKILATAESFIQKMGYNAFSYKDIANVVGIKTSSIHYYYPTKEDLAIAVIDWQLNRLSSFLNELRVNNALSLQEKLLSLVNTILSVTLNDEMKMCLGGILASEMISFGDLVKMKVRSFFNALKEYIELLIHESDFSIQSPSQGSDLTKHMLVQLEGGLLLSRLYDDSSYMDTVKQFIHTTF